MKVNAANTWKLIVVIMVLGLLLVACDRQAGSDSSGTESGTLAMVNGVTIEQSDNHSYATVDGNYPDACTRISSVKQTVEGSTISITLLTDKPADSICASVLTPFVINILLTTGGLMPQEYTVVVNEDPSATLSFE